MNGQWFWKVVFWASALAVAGCIVFGVAVLAQYGTVSTPYTTYSSSSGSSRLDTALSWSPYPSWQENKNILARHYYLQGMSREQAKQMVRNTETLVKEHNRLNPLFPTSMRQQALSVLPYRTAEQRQADWDAAEAEKERVAQERLDNFYKDMRESEEVIRNKAIADAIESAEFEREMFLTTPNSPSRRQYKAFLHDQTKRKLMSLGLSEEDALYWADYTIGKEVETDNQTVFFDDPEVNKQYQRYIRAGFSDELATEWALKAVGK